MTAVDGEVCRFGDDDNLGPESVFVDDVLPAETVAIFFLHTPNHVESKIIIETELLDKLSTVDN